MDLILSDIHANLPALREVLKYARRRTIRRFVILGDLVGYGAQPNEVLARIQGLRSRILVRGNHDRACAFEGEDEHFSLPAKGAAWWTRQRLTAENRGMLCGLPEGPLQVGDDYLIAHGSPLNEDAYLLHPQDALEAFGGFTGQLCFFGHSHLPCCFELDESRRLLSTILPEPGEWFSLKKGCRYLVNPGSVGQPRDRDPRLSFMTYDPRRRRVRLHRLEYDHADAAQRILDAKLHPNLAERLFYGI
nr:metallophosphoesterase family protein [uncultured Holophaga sp.]